MSLLDKFNFGNSIKKRALITFVISGIIIVSTVVGGFVKSINDRRNALAVDKLHKSLSILENSENKLYQKGDLIASNFVNSSVVQKAYKMEDETEGRVFLRQNFDEVFKAIKRNSDIGKDLRVHFHKAPAKSFLRIWENPGSKKEGGDDLSLFRKTILNTYKTKKPTSGIEVGKGGLVFRSVLPIFDKLNNNYMGSVESFFSFKYLKDKQINKNKDLFFTVFLDKEKSKLAWKLKGNPKVGDYTCVNKEIPKEIKKFITEEKIISGLKKETIVVDRDFGYLIKPLDDFSGNVIGVEIMVYNFTNLFTSDFNSLVQFLIIGSLGVLFGTALIVLLILSTINKFTKISTRLKKVAQDIETGNLSNIKTRIGKFRENLDIELIPIADSLEIVTTQYEKPINILINAITKTANGEVLEHSNQGFKGEFAKAENSINELSKNIHNFKDELNLFGKKIGDGELSYSLDPSKQNGYWAELFESVNGVVFAITFPVNDMLQSIKALGNNDLTKNIDTSKYYGEFKNYINGVNVAIKNINDLVVNLSGKTNVLSGASNNLEGVADNLKSSTDNMIHEVNGVVNSIEEMNANGNLVAAAVEEMSINANTVSDNATETLGYMENVAAAVEELSISISGISENTVVAAKISDDAQRAEKETVEYTTKLSEAVRKISQVTEMIKKIAEQTNLLALNATIEAASAGEAGKGFAVVANEIKELAHQSSKSAENIEVMVDEVKNATDGSVGKIKEIGEVIGKTKEIISGINESMDQQQSAVSEISNNTGETLSRTKEVVTNINEIASVTSDTANNVGEISTGLSGISISMGSVKSSVQDVGSVVEKIMLSGITIKNTSNEFKEITSLYTCDGEVTEYDLDIFFPWKIEVLDVGSKFINGQHKILVDLINDLYSAMNRGKGGTVIGKILQDLSDYVEKHFRDEEKMMDKYNYSGLGEQKELHAHYEGKIIDYILAVQKGKAAVSIDLLEFLKGWLYDHILVTDMKYKEFFIDKGVEQSNY